MKRYDCMYFKNPEWVADIVAKIEAGEKVWLVEGEGKRKRAILVVSGYKFDKPDSLGASGLLHLDRGPGGRWPETQWPEWVRKQIKGTP